jgi:hypothetical protein
MTRLQLVINKCPLRTLGFGGHLQKFEIFDNIFKGNSPMGWGQCSCSCDEPILLFLYKAREEQCSNRPQTFWHP